MTSDMQSETQKYNNAADEIDLGKLFNLLLEAKWLIITVTFVFALVGVVYALQSTPIYKADALIQVESKNTGVSSLINEGLGEMFTQESSATTEIEIIKSRMVLGETVDKLNLTTIAQPKSLPVIGKGLNRLLGEQNSINVTRFEMPDYLTGAGAVTLQLSNQETGEYQLIDSNGKVVLSGFVGELAERGDWRLFVRDIDAQAGDEFVLVKRSRLAAIQWLQTTLSISERSTQTGILQLAFEGESKPQIQAILDDISMNYFMQNVARQSAEAEKSLTFLQKNLPQIKASLNQSEDRLNRFRQQNESVDLGLEAQSALKVVVDLEAQLNELTFKESDISQRFTKDHPSYKSLLDKRDTLLQERERLNRQIQKLPKTQREVLRMTRDVEVNQQIYIQLLNKVQELNIMKASAVGNVRILDTAQVYAHPIKPKKSLIVVLATLLGGMLSVAVVLVKAAFHQGVTSPDEIEAIGVPVYTSVPKSEMQVSFAAATKKGGLGRRKKNDSTGLLAKVNPADLSIEALRGLRTSLHFAMLEAKNNIVMISGPAPGVGKSFIATNFAAVAAGAGQKVLLIDADMRKGYLQRSFGLKWDNGLSDFLADKNTKEQVVKASGIDGLDVITRGMVPPNPSELLMHQRFRDLLDWASTQYDLVLVDTPPVLAVTDPSIVGAQAGTTLMVTRFGQNSVKEIEIANDRFKKAGIEVKGVILNAIEKKASNSYGYYQYAYDNRS